MFLPKSGIIRPRTWWGGRAGLCWPRTQSSTEGVLPSLYWYLWGWGCDKWCTKKLETRTIAITGMMSHCKGDAWGRVSRQEVVSSLSFCLPFSLWAPYWQMLKDGQKAKERCGLQNPSPHITKHSIEGGGLKLRACSLITNTNSSKRHLPTGLRKWPGGLSLPGDQGENNNIASEESKQ